MIYIWEGKKEERERDVKEQGSKRTKKRDEREQESKRTGERLDMIEAVRAPNCVFARDAFRGRWSWRKLIASRLSDGINDTTNAIILNQRSDSHTTDIKSIFLFLLIFFCRRDFYSVPSFSCTVKCQIFHSTGSRRPVCGIYFRNDCSVPWEDSLQGF